jgi:hypothetical protein
MARVEKIMHRWFSLLIKLVVPRTPRPAAAVDTSGYGGGSMRILTVVAYSVLFAGLGCGRRPAVAEKPPATPESLKAEIETIRASTVPWRQIAWKRCLLEVLKESRDKSKPVLIWMFIERPVDDERC